MQFLLFVFVAAERGAGGARGKQSPARPTKGEARRNQQAHNNNIVFRGRPSSLSGDYYFCSTTSESTQTTMD
jgi:hypothetical protein